MPVPSQGQPSIAPSPVTRPEGMSLVFAKPSPAFRVFFQPGSVELFDLSGAPPALLEKLGLEPGRYWLPTLEQHFAVPGANGVVGDPTWKTEDILQRGYRDAFTAEAREAGFVLLDAYIEIPAEFLPAGVAPGPILRRQACQYQGETGWRYMLPWETLRASGANRPAKCQIDRALMGCWIASLVIAGTIQPASEAIVNERQATLEDRIVRYQSQTTMAPEIRAEKIEGAKAVVKAADAPVLTQDTPKPVVKPSRKRAEA